MKKILLLLSLFSYILTAQTLPTEKVFFASDRLHYDVGDSVFISGWLMRTDNKTTLPYSRYLYLEMVDNNDSIYARQKLSVGENGEFFTVLPLVTSTHYGMYYLRAYSKMMCNFSDITIPSYPVEICKGDFTMRNSETEVQCRIFPEGGHLIASGVQKVAVYINDKYGNPCQTTFSVIDSDGNTMFSSETNASGWQMLAIEPVIGKQYYIKMENSNALVAFPAIENDMPSLRLMHSKGRVRFFIEGKIPSDAKLFVYNQSTGLMMLPAKKQGEIDLDGISDGLVTLILTDSKYNTLSEGHVWQHRDELVTSDIRKEYSVGETISPDAIVGDTSLVSMVRFIPMEEMMMSLTGDFIPMAESVINFQADLLSDIPFPRNYAVSEDMDRMADVDCWLLSAKFCRLDVAAAMENGWKAKYQPEVANVIKGKVYGNGRNWKLKEGHVVAYQQSNAVTFAADMNKDGTFYMPVGDFQQGDSFFVCAFDKKDKADLYEYAFLSDTIPSVMNYRKYDLLRQSVQTDKDGKQEKFNLKGVNDIPEVVITSHVKKDYVQEEKEFYGNKYISEEEMYRRNYQSFQQMIYHFAAYMKLMSVSIEDVDENKGAMKTVQSGGAASLEWHLYPAARTSTLSGKNEILIYIDGVLTSATNAVNFNMDDVATVEFLGPSQALGRHPNCLDGCLEIKTKGYKPQVVKSKGVMYTPAIGIANYGMKTPVAKAPSKPGEYMMIIDRLTSDFQTLTVAYKVTVK